MYASQVLNVRFSDEHGYIWKLNWITGWRVVLIKSQKTSKTFQCVIRNLHHFFYTDLRLQRRPNYLWFDDNQPLFVCENKTILFVLFLFWFLTSRALKFSLQLSPQRPSLNTLSDGIVWTRIRWKQIFFSLAKVTITRSWNLVSSWSKHSANIYNPDMYHLTVHFHSWCLHLQHWKPYRLQFRNTWLGPNLWS